MRYNIFYTCEKLATLPRHIDRFKLIDNQLNKFAKKYNAIVYTNASAYGEIMNDKFGERRVWWEDGLIEKSVYIMPASLSKKTISPLWQVIILACRTEGKYRFGGRPMLDKVLLENVEFEVIENSIDQLLQQAA